MDGVFRVAKEEWRYWLRSRLAISAAMLLMIVIITAVVSTYSRIQSAAASQIAMQQAAEETFLSQPDRHPHRMVHYGHYVFRKPTPLAAIDPGVDPLTGTVMFLEGHRQNSATFPASYTTPRVAGFSYLTPAFAYQVLVPLVLIVVGFSVFSRERELRTEMQLLAQGLDGKTLWAGKSVALLGLSALFLLPLAIGAIATAAHGESVLAAIAIIVVYYLYLAFWSQLVLAVSTWTSSSALSLLWCCVAWVAMTVVIPRVSSDAADSLVDVRGKIASDLALLDELRAAGDVHDATDPNFQRLRAELLEQYNVETVEALPVNFRGVVAVVGEEKQTEILNRYADERMAQEQQQAGFVGLGSVVSPALAIRSASMRIAGSDLVNHHRFLREAETARYEFVQGLNKAHAERLSYEADINRNNGDAGWERARISADNWRVLQSFDFRPAPAPERVAAASTAVGWLALWILVVSVLGRGRAGDLTKQLHAS
ncbi:MAG: DUF3526 domain-containing protein [Pseudomonadota bacterium]